MRVLFLGDIVGRPGREAVIASVRRLREELALDVVAANAENASAGLGLKPDQAKALLAAGVDMLTTGNHVWKFKELHSVLTREPRLIRPANFPAGAPGRGLGIYESRSGAPYAVLNLQGRTFMQAVDCPFAAADALLASLPPEVRVVLVDFHAEATSEKIALAYYLRGRVSAVLGTHTHVQTSDARLLDPYGAATAAITDLGMCGPEESILGMDPAPIVHRFLSGLPTRFTVTGGRAVLEGVIIDIDEATGRPRSIEAFRHRG